MQMQSTFVVLMPMSSSDTCRIAMHALVITRVLLRHLLLRLVSSWLNTLSCRCFDKTKATTCRIAVTLLWIKARWKWFFNGATQTMKQHHTDVNDQLQEPRHAGLTNLFFQIGLHRVDLELDWQHAAINLDPEQGEAHCKCWHTLSCQQLAGSKRICLKLTYQNAAQWAAVFHSIYLILDLRI